jgi:hypothetical protein
MRTAIIKVKRMDYSAKFWLGVIQELQRRKFKVYKNFKETGDLNIILSGLFENPTSCKNKKVLILERNEWAPNKLNAWDNMFRDIVKHYYDEIIDVTGKTPYHVAGMVIDYINAQERKADKS